MKLNMKSKPLDASILKKNSEFVEQFLARKQIGRGKSNLGLMFPRQNTFDFLSEMAIGLFDQNPSYYLGYPLGSPLRNPPVVESAVYGRCRSVMADPDSVKVFDEHMARLDRRRYIGTAFPKRFNAQRHRLPGKLYTADVAYFVLTGNSIDDITSMSQIQSKAVKAWEC